MQIDDYLAAIPLLHSWDGGVTWNSGGFGPEHLRAFIDLTRGFGDCRVIETGAGNSTIAFLIGGAQRVVSIAPEAALFERIDNYCQRAGISTSRLEPHIGLSEWELPILAVHGEKFDIALVDGCHGWPNTFVDFFYVNAMLSAGAVLLIDDIQLHSVKEIARWLKADPDRFELVLDLGKTLAFRKLTAEPAMGEWNDQPYIVERSRLDELSGRPFELGMGESWGRDA